MSEAPKTIEELVRRVEANYAGVEMIARAYEEYMELSSGLFYRVIPVSLVCRAEGIGPDVERDLIAWAWNQFEAASQNPMFKSGKLLWRVMPGLQVESDLEHNKVYTQFRCRVGVLPTREHWRAHEVWAQPFTGKVEGELSPILA